MFEIQRKIDGKYFTIDTTHFVITGLRNLSTTDIKPGQTLRLVRVDPMDNSRTVIRKIIDYRDPADYTYPK